VNWYLGVLQKYGEFGGRAQRAEYWYFVLFNILVAFALAVVEGIAGIFPESDQSVLVGIYELAILIPSLAVSVRRLHDTSRSGWWLLLGLVPFGSLVVLVFLLQGSDPSTNRFGTSLRPVAGLETA